MGQVSRPVRAKAISPRSANWPALKLMERVYVSGCGLIECSVGADIYCANNALSLRLLGFDGVGIGNGGISYESLL